MQVPGWFITVPAGLIALIGVIADRGEKLLQILAMVTAWTAKLPFGFWSFLLSLALALLVWATCMVKVRRSRDGSRPHDTATIAAVLTAIAVALGQQATVGFGNGVALMAIFTGLGSGLLAPFLGEVLRRLWIARLPP